MNGVVLVFILTLTTECLACSFKLQETTPDGIWDETDVSRKLSSSHCGCGSSSEKEKQGKLWNLYVHSTIATNKVKTCTGTIIASNLIITSHKCLTLEGKEMNVYDMWRPIGGSRNMVDKSDVLVTSKFEGGHPTGTEYSVKDIIFNVQYSYNSALQKGLPENDILIIVLEEDLFANNAHISVCLPHHSDNLDLIGQNAVYYGAGPKENIAEIKSLVVRGGGADGCGTDDEDGESTAVYKTFCVDHLSADAPVVEGGPLIVKSEAQVPYLVGIATKVSEEKVDSKIEFHTYFSSTIASIKYLEYHAKRQKSTWCTMPRLKLKEKGSVTEDERPWEDLKSVERDESLNCVCGQRNVDLGGRIAGGVEATPYEYGWMTVLLLQMPGARGTSLCGGSVINDRMILTAAHCVVNEREIRQPRNPTRKLSIPPKNIEVTLYAHKKKGDTQAINKTVGAVLYHPGYIEPRKQNYYDYDVALLILNEPLHFPGDGNGIHPICLPQLGTDFPIQGKTATVAGWGLTNPTDHYSTAKVLQKVDVPIQELSYCSNVARTKVTENFICAGTLNMYKDAAGGDSGGPLMIDNDGQWVEVGIVSWGEDVHSANGKTQTAALYTDVQKVLPYIDYHAQRVGAKWCKSSPD